MAVDNLSIPEDEWKTKKTAGLLKYLLVHKNRPASQDDLADLYIARGEQRKAESLLIHILALDEYNEEACLRLLRLLIAQNQRSRAVKLDAKFSDHFEKELNMKPDKCLSALSKADRRFPA